MISDEESKEDGLEGCNFGSLEGTEDSALRDSGDGPPLSGEAPMENVQAAEDSSEDPLHPRQRKLTVAADARWTDRVWEVFTTFWPLGLIAFGGPTAHVAILRDHLVVQRDWLDEDQFMELFAIGQVSERVVLSYESAGPRLFSFVYPASRAYRVPPQLNWWLVRL
jgi:Chromate transporter